MNKPFDASAVGHVVELSVDGRVYRLALPHAETDYIQRKLVEENQPYELPMLSDMRARLSPGDLVVDVGANVGNHTLYLAAVVGCRVEAIEPNPELSGAILTSTELNGDLRGVNVHTCGLGRAASSASFAKELRDNLGGQRLQVGAGPIPVRTLDSFDFDGPIRALKIDVEGMELDVLEGGASTIARDRPLLYIECMTEPQFRTVSLWMEAREYCHWAVFNATPTHLFMPAEKVSLAQQLGRLQYRAGQDEYRDTRLLREVRLRLGQAQEREKAAQTALQSAQAALQAAHAGAAEASRRLQSELTRARAEVEKAQAAAEQQGRTLQERAMALERERQEHQALLLKVEMRDMRIAALERRAEALAERNERIRASSSHRVGVAFVDARRSPGALLRLPTALWRIYRDALDRRAKRGREPAAPAKHSASAPAPKGRAVRAVARLASVPPELRKLKVACVMDEFTQHSFAPECELKPLLPANWQTQVEEFAPDLVFIESAWRGADEQWARMISNPSPELMGLLDWCSRRGVPSMFWNKEDPVHFGTFLHVARAVDHVFTTDVDCIARYKRELGHDRVYLLPFAAQPALHNPLERYTRADAFCFAGSYYLKYPERQRDFDTMMEVVSRLRSVEIYDRNYAKGHPDYKFPPQFERHIVGTLPADQMDRAYKGYRFGVNMNTIKQSQTMFARRVFELLASNTVVVSNFSRGVRALFGDLVVCSDSPAELERRLAALCADESLFRRFRLAGLRKVLSEHTYAHRLAYIVGKLAGRPVAAAAPQVLVVARANDPIEAARLQQMYERQSHPNRRLCLLASGDALPSTELDGASWVAVWSVEDYYGPHYLADLVLGGSFSDAGVIGKATHHAGSATGVSLRDDGQQYRFVPRLALRAALVRAARWAELAVVPDRIEDRTVEGDGLLSLDEFHYCRNAVAVPAQQLAGAVDDAPGFAHGMALAALLPMAEAIAPAPAAADTPVHALPGLDAAALAERLPAALPSRVSLRLADGCLELISTLPADRHAYVFLRESFARTDVNLELNSRFHLMLQRLDDDLDLRTVFEFLDAQQQKIGHSINKVGAASSMAIPNECRFVRFGLRVKGSGSAVVERLLLADVRERPSTFVPTARHLLLTKQYPAYDDLYRYGFVHSRVREYRARGLQVDVFKLVADEPVVFREFENIDVVHGDAELLDFALGSGRYEHVLVHLLDHRMWEVLARHVGRIQITVWVHGAEIQMAHRRSFEHALLERAEVARQQALAAKRREFWRPLLLQPPARTRFVFVSDYFARESLEDLDIDPSSVPYEVIHNYIDSSIFAYRPKTAEHRLRVLSIRPFASRKYANDLTVAAIRLLSARPCFGALHFHIVGEGPLFAPLTEPLRGMRNVKLEERFLTQAEIAALHADYGIFLTPTRMDAQGVSRDEAMASGLVPITNRVAAVPEFVDDSCGILVDPESAEQLADAIEALYRDPERFLRLSRAASERVNRQSGRAATIGRELSLLGGPTVQADAAYSA